jgi:hypothetical protein
MDLDKRPESRAKQWLWIHVAAITIILISSVTIGHFLFRLLNRYPYHYAAFKIEQESAQHVWVHVCNGREQSPQIMGSFVRCSDALATSLQWAHSVAIERVLGEWRSSGNGFCDGACHYVLYKTLDYFASSSVTILVVLTVLVAILGWMTLRARDQYCLLEFMKRMQLEKPGDQPSCCIDLGKKNA